MAYVGRVMAHSPLGQVCVTLGLLTDEQVRAILDAIDRSPDPSKARFGSLAMELGYLDDTGLARALAQQFRLNMVPEDRVEKLAVAPEVLALLPPRLMRDRLLVPTFLEAERRVLSLLCADPTDLDALRLAQSAAQATRLRLFVAPRGAIDRLLKRLLPDDDASDVRVRSAMAAVRDEVEPASAPLGVAEVVIEPDPDRATALRRLAQLEGHTLTLVPGALDVTRLLGPGRATRVMFRRQIAAQIETFIPNWRRICPELIIVPVDGFGPGQGAHSTSSNAHSFWLGLLEFVLLAGETRQMEARARLRRTYRLACALADDLELPLELRDAVAVTALFVDIDELSLMGGMLDQRDEGRRFAVAATVLRQFDPPWDIDGLLSALERRVAGQASPGEHIAAEVLYTARAVVRAGALDADDPVAALGADAARHDGRVLRAVAAVQRRQALRTRVAAGGGTSALVILAEREVAVVTALEALLSQAGFEVVAVADGEQAIQVAHRTVPAAIIANQRLPRKDGLSMLLELRRDARLRGVPVLLLSDTGGSADITRGLELGAEDVIPKPINAQVVLARLRRAVNRQAGSGSGIVGQLGDLSLPELLQTLTFGGRSAVVQINGAGETGSVHVRDGRLVAAVHGARVGEDAFMSLVGLSSGRFSVKFEDAGLNNLSAATDYLILEALRRRDEARARAGG